MIIPDVCWVYLVMGLLLVCIVWDISSNGIGVRCFGICIVGRVPGIHVMYNNRNVHAWDYST